MQMTEKKPADASLSDWAMTVLLVDDQPIVADAVRRMLAAEKDMVLHYCQDPARALGMAAEIKPTIILLDLVMPEIDGLTLARFFRAHSQLKDVPLIVLSSREEPATKAESFAMGASDYLVKLPDRVELIARIRHHSRGYINLLQRNEAYDALLQSRQELAREIRRAADYVASLLPLPLSDGMIRSEWKYEPSAALGGDSFGYHWVDDEHFAIYLLDVCDHGVGPALLSVSALNVLRSQSLPNVDFRAPEQVLSALNSAFQMEQHNNLYFTIWYGVFNSRNRQLIHASAGHPPALLFTKDGEAVQELMTPAMVIGGMAESVYQSRAVTIKSSASLYVFSDGVYEIQQPDGSIWTLAGLKNFLAGCSREGSELEALHQHVGAMRQGAALEDDFSIVKIDFN